MTEQATEPKATDATAQLGKAPALKAILAKKIGMTRVYNPKGEFIPVTVLESAACRVVRVVTQAKNGYEAVQLGLGDVKAKNINKPESGHFAAANVPMSRWLREFRVPKTDGFTAGQTVHVEWHGWWFEARVIRVIDAATVHVHRVGYPPARDSDEPVSKLRVGAVITDAMADTHYRSGR